MTIKQSGTRSMCWFPSKMLQLLQCLFQSSQLLLILLLLQPPTADAWLTVVPTTTTTTTITNTISSSRQKYKRPPSLVWLKSTAASENPHHQPVESAARIPTQKMKAKETNHKDDHEANMQESRWLYQLQGKILKDMRQVCLDYNMIENGDHIMVCVSGGKDSATLLYLLQHLQHQLQPQGVNFNITAVHVDQKQPGYNGQALVHWLQDDLQVPFQIIEEDTYSIVLDKTAPGKTYCAVCSRLRRGILYSAALDLQCNKICLGHHADDCLETLLLNMIHGGQLKAMPARYTSQRGSLAVMRPLITCREEDIAAYAALQNFPILPCNLCSSQGETNMQRPQMKLLLQTLQGMNPTAGANMVRACQNVRPSHLLDQSLRRACGMDPITGQVMHQEESEDDEDEDAF